VLFEMVGIRARPSREQHPKITSIRDRCASGKIDFTQGLENYVGLKNECLGCEMMLDLMKDLNLFLVSVSKNFLGCHKISQFR